MWSYVRVIVATGVMAAFLFSVTVFWVYTTLKAHGSPKDHIRLVISSGTTLSQTAHQLYSHGIIPSPTLFILVARIKGMIMKAGEFDFEGQMTTKEVLLKIANNKTVVRRLSIPEGLSKIEVAHLLESAPGLKGALTTGILEGTLLPDTYYYSYGDQPDDLVERMTAAMNKLLNELWPNRTPGLPIKSRREAVILASIVEKETAIASERPRIAAVFLNRLINGMRLQSDPTVSYAISGGNKQKRPLITRADLQFDHPYNTYLHAGLPPGPISNPGRAAIEAVLQPLKTNELYFVADGTGGHVFARTFSEHSKNVTRWRELQRLLKIQKSLSADDGANNKNGGY